MTQSIKKAIDALNALEGLSEEEQKSLTAGVPESAESTKAHRVHARREETANDCPFWEVVDEITHDVPDEIWEISSDTILYALRAYPKNGQYLQT